METNKFLLMVMVAGIFVGCASTDSIEKRYWTVKYNDGVNFNEAKLIAQKMLLESRYTDSYNVFEPQLIMNEATQKYQNFWFVTFASTDKASTYEHIFVVDKNTGGIVRSSQYQPSTQRDFDWLIK